MRDDQNQQVTIRRLPNGPSHDALLGSLDGRLLTINVPPLPSEWDLNAGDFAEVTSLNFVYLGEVSVSQRQVVVLNVEHALDRAALSRIQQVWQVPAGD